MTLVKEAGLGCLLYKRDLKQAYRQIFVDPGDIHMLGYSFKGHVFFDQVLPMGLRSACQACQRVTNAVAHISAQAGFKIVNYIDDMAGAEVPGRAMLAFESLAAILHMLGLQESIQKASPPNTNMCF